MKSSRRGMFLSGVGGGGDIRRQSLTVTENGTYTAPSGVAYTPVIVNVETPTPPTPPTPVTPTSGVGLGDVNFIDYDGSIVYAYSKDEFLASTALPANPSHDGLTAQGWNYTLAQAKAYVTKYGFLEIGQNYVTTSGDTEFDIVISPGRTNPNFGICVNGTVRVQWGDGRTDTVTGTSSSQVVNTSHSYNPGAYTVKITPESGTEISFMGSPTTGSYIFHGGGSSGQTPNHAYNNIVQAARLGNGIKVIQSRGFYNLRSMRSITIPKALTNTTGEAFNGCRNLTGFVTSENMVTVGSSAFQECSSLRMVSIGPGMTTLYSYAFSGCQSLLSFTPPEGITIIQPSVLNGCSAVERTVMPDTVTTYRGYTQNCTGLGTFRFNPTASQMPDGMFYGCASLKGYEMTATMTTLGEEAFYGCNTINGITVPEGITAVPAKCFQNCYCLTTMTLPSTITSIGNSAFDSCYSLAYLDMTAINTVPTLTNSNAFNNTPSDFVIKVPSAMLPQYENNSVWRQVYSKLVGV